MKKDPKRYCMTFFSALANPLRISILQSLLKEEKTVSELTKDVKDERTLISHNLATLLKVNLISFKKRGKERVYYPNEKILVPLFFLIENFVCSNCSFKSVCSVLNKGDSSASKLDYAELVQCSGCK
ncbi:winged helix-turn-helix transcriptional regulator [Candidatus Micrarchaeota archaeon]|nr:winged helix-turn-helix transcriptional regulator [Candidatus Micrarchaeota archaeon]